MKRVNLIITMLIVAMILVPLNVIATENLNVEKNITQNENICKFSWTTNPEQKYIKDEKGEIVFNKDKGIPNLNEDYIENARIELISVEYKKNGQNIKRYFTDSKTLNELDRGEKETKAGVFYHKYSDGNIEFQYQTKQNNENVDFDDGSITMPKGSIVTTKIIPNYGYQITSFGINQDKIVPGKNISEFTFEVQEKDFHLGVEITKVDNIAKTDAKGIVSGNVILDSNEIDSGTIKLSVDDADITEAKKEEFQKEITRIAEGYTISNIININLDQVYYKGKTDEFWQGYSLKELKKDAIISLKLDKELNKKDIIIVHNIDDSQKYEKMEILDYDKESKTITFKANSFSNYAIATKLGENMQDENNSNITNTTESNEQIIENSNNIQNEQNLKIGYGFIILFIIIVASIVTVIVVIINRNIKIT